MHGVGEEKEGGKLISFALACISGLTFSMILSGLFSEINAPEFFVSRFFLNIVSGMALFMMAPFLLIPARILTDVMRLIQGPRGYSDIMTGALIGSATFLPALTGSDPLDWKALAFVAGGAIGGFTYWRSRGYPGLRRKHVGSAELGFSTVTRINPG